MKSNTLLAVFVVLLSLFVSSVAFAQLSEMDPTSIFRDDIVRIGAPILETLCHIPPGNPANAQTIEVAQAAAAAHLAHGDLLGECPFECDGVPAPVAQTGQTLCSGPGGLIDCTGTGQDGEYQIGVTIPDQLPRFNDNLDGTIGDNLTGLIWLKNAACTEFFAGDTTGSNLRSWVRSLEAANSLSEGFCNLTDGSQAGDWRLANVRELLSLIDYGEASPALPDDHPFSGIGLEPPYWSSTIVNDGFGPGSAAAWVINFELGRTGEATSLFPVTLRVLPVRGGQ